MYLHSPLISFSGGERPECQGQISKVVREALTAWRMQQWTTLMRDHLTTWGMISSDNFGKGGELHEALGSIKMLQIL